MYKPCCFTFTGRWKFSNFSTFLAILNNTSVKIFVAFLCTQVFFHLGYIIEQNCWVRWQHYVQPFEEFKTGFQNTLSIPTSSMRVSKFPYSQEILDIIYLFDSSYPGGCEIDLYVELVCIFLLANGAEYLSLCLLVICTFCGVPSSPLFL